ncbi:hypothetical protein Rhe02_70040 [Rhizocola hellebori]|uniref:DUF2029 domain-containing protein n=1 Tax=Rhizocola hellebori TaxID=1392758 RepID=A0A8J3VJX3_9ACTN|nr:glycosyltransferase family 87 protein [Rhizocola hellebori]GIH08937.1 hypothetical protein Rhe02_70040 [Rhizocola hellebori]
MIALVLDFALYALSALFAEVTANTSTLAPHRSWGAIAFWGYAAAALLVFLLPKHRLRLTAGAWVAVAWIPMVVLAWRGAAQEEVLVVEESARRLLQTGSPYLDRASIALLPDPLLGYTPYQPGMAIFGLPRAVIGDFWWTDARIYFGLVTAAVLYGAVKLLWPHPHLTRALQMATVLPLCALTLATGGDDIPVLALCLFAFALAARDRFGWAGVAIGVACAMKLFAWPVALVIGVYAVSRRYTIGAVGIPVAAMLPALIINSQAFLENVIRFPTGHGLVTSPAASPLIGYQIAKHVPSGRYIALALLVAAGFVIAAYLASNPPRDMGKVAWVCAVGLLAAILLLPSTRFGYLLYPVAFAFWAPCLRAQPALDPLAKDARYQQA